jgi:hypothetical protein
VGDIGLELPAGRFPLMVVASGGDLSGYIDINYGNDLALPVDEESLYTTFGLPR